MSSVKGLNKDVQQLVRSISHISGVELRGGNGRPHVQVYLDGTYVTTLPRTPSDYRWRENALSDLRRSGITPSTRPQKREIEITQLISVDEIRARVKAMPVLLEFCRVLVDDLSVISPGRRTYKTADSAASSLHYFVKTEGGGLSQWAHVAVDEAIRLWDRKQAGLAGIPEAQVTSAGGLSVEDLPVWESMGRVTLTVRLSEVAKLLSRFGIELEVK